MAIAAALAIESKTAKAASRPVAREREALSSFLSNVSLITSG